jgi:hypothetical protein
MIINQSNLIHNHKKRKKMKKIKLLYVLAMLVAFSFTSFAQDTTFVPGVDGVNYDLKSIIDADSTLAVRPVYKLQRGIVYFVDGQIVNKTPLVIVGETSPAETVPATVMYLTDESGVAVNQMFEAKADIKFENLQCVGMDNLETHHNWLVSNTADIRIEVKNCLFNLSDNWQGAFWIKGNNNDFFFDNSVAMNFQRDDGFDWTRIIFNSPGFQLDTLRFQNSTWFGQNGELLSLKQAAKTTIWDHCTFVAVGQAAATQYNFANAQFTNNIFFDVNTKGDWIKRPTAGRGFFRGETNGDFETPLAPLCALPLDNGIWTSAQIDSILAASGVTQQTVVMKYYAFALTPEVRAFQEALDDTIGLVVQMTNPQTMDLVAAEPGVVYENNVEVDPGFTNNPLDYTKLLAWLQYQLNSETPANYLYIVDDSKFNWPWPLKDHMDFSYSATLTGTDGLPMGDLFHWYPAEYQQWLVTGVEESITDQLPSEYALSQNYPNPFNPTTNIQFSIPKSGNVQLNVFNVLGQKVAQLVDQELKAGTHKVDFDASQLTSGIYFYTLESGSFSQTNKMMLLK